MSKKDYQYVTTREAVELLKKEALASPARPASQFARMILDMLRKEERK